MFHYRNGISILVLIVIFLLTACQQDSGASIQTPSSDNADSPTVTESAGTNNENEISETADTSQSDGEASDENDVESQSQDSAEPSFTATPDLRLKPEDWREWPVVPEISPFAVSVYQKGIALGNDPHALSKIGDCQSIKEVLLGIYDLPGRYSLREEDAYLQEIIDQYTGSFNRNGMAVRGGFNAATVLSPIWADPEFCEPGENPIQCEYRVHKPTMVIISLEVWWDGRSPERYEQYMRKIIEYSIEQGVVPILSTKADNVEGDHSINYTTAKLAYEYDIPMWNFWRAVQTLPNQGIDPERDGFHISVAAWNERSYTALQTIAAVYAAAEGGTVVEVAQNTPEPEEVEEQLPNSQLIFEAQELQDTNLTGRLYFEMTETIDGEVLPAGIYALDYDLGEFKQVFSAGAQILDGDSKNGLLILDHDLIKLVKPDSEIIVLDDAILDADSYYLLSENEILISYNTSENELEANIIELKDNGEFDFLDVYFPVGFAGLSEIQDATQEYLVGTVGNCDTGDCQSVVIGNYRSGDSATSKTVDYFEYPSMNDRGVLAYWRPVNNFDSLHFMDIPGGGVEKFIGLYGNVFLDQAWQNDGSLLAAIKMERSDYYGRATEILHYVVDPTTSVMREYASMNGLNPIITWSPDDQYLVTSVTEIDDEGNSTITIRLLDLLTTAGVNPAGNIDLTSDTFIAISTLIWID